jgi:zinc protease
VETLVKRKFMLSFLSRGLAAAIAVVIFGSLPLSFSFNLPFFELWGGQAIAQSDTSKQLVAQSSELLTGNVVKTVLDNGLTVLTKEVNTAPVVSVQIWYRVGSQNEKLGITGISHQLEPLMFN